MPELEDRVTVKVENMRKIVDQPHIMRKADVVDNNQGKFTPWKFVEKTSQYP